jgi:hypothetical protein
MFPVSLVHDHARKLNQNGAFQIIDVSRESIKEILELSIIKNAASAAGFLGINLNFEMCQNAPFRAIFLS